MLKILGHSYLEQNNTRAQLFSAKNTRAQLFSAKITGAQLFRAKHKAVGSGPVGPVWAGPTFGAWWVW